MGMNCPECKIDLSENANFDNLLNENLHCPNCNQHLQLEFDESVDGESEWWWFVKYKK